MSTVSKEEIFARVQKMLAEAKDLDPSTISLSSAVKEDLGADSLDVVEMVLDLEDELGIEIPDSDVFHLTTVEKIVDYIYGKLCAE